MDQKLLLESLKRLKAIADVGLLYCRDEYDRERYTEVQEIVFRLLNGLTGYGMDSLSLSFPQRADYPTAKVDIRGFILSDDHKILLVKEVNDGKWSLPGGWADIGFSPKETVIKETKEETGIEVTVQGLVAVFDKRLHPHPTQAEYVYKLVFFCKPVSPVIAHGFDIADAGFFAPDNLPPLSEERILESQIRLVFNKIMAGDLTTYFE